MEPGHVLGDRWTVLGQIAEGTGSTVWEARDGETGEVVAVKAVSLERAGWRAEVRDRFQQEAHLLQQVHHQHVVGVRAQGETEEGELYLVLDRLSGETLADRLARPPRLAWREATAIALEIARGTEALHARGIVHRDLKPANVILHEEGGGAPVHDGGSAGSADSAGSAPKPPVCKIIDLGISKARAVAADPVLFATLTATGQVLGTPEYMSREQALGERDVDARTDVWAVGVVLYEMLAGRRPFDGPNVNAVLAAIRKGPPPRLSTVAPRTPEALVQVVDRCLAAERDARYRDGAALSEAIAAAVDRGEAGEARAALRRRAAITGGVVLLAAMASAAAWPRRTPPQADRIPAVAPPETPVATGADPPVTVPVATARPAAPAGAPSATVPAAPPSASAPKGGRVITRVNSAGF